jgi:uncharacterized cupredoxin-like copper-binding protein
MIVVVCRWEFGTGISYTTFSCKWDETAAASAAGAASSVIWPTAVAGEAEGYLGSYSTAQLAESDGMAYRVVVTNTGKVQGDYVAMAYVSPPNGTAAADGSVSYTALAPKKQLFGFGRVSLAPGESATVDFLLELGAARGERLPERAARAGAEGMGGIRFSSATADEAGRLRLHPGVYGLAVTDGPPRWFEAVGSSVVVQEQL